VAPSATEVLFALGAGDAVVGVTDYCRRPPEAAARARIGGYMTPSLERVLGLAPDLVCYFPSVLQDPTGFAGGLAAAGVPGLPLAMGDIAQVYDAVGQLGSRVGRVAEAEALVARLRAALAKARAESAGRPVRRALVAVDGDPKQCFVAGGGTFVAELLALAGGENVAAARPGYYVISAEALLAADPDVIIDASRVHEDPAAAATATSAAWEPLGHLRAVRSGRVHALADDAAIQPGLRLADGVQALARCLHRAEDR
jgi:iron complex transport system substrate-binding protein